MPPIQPTNQPTTPQVTQKQPVGPLVGTGIVVVVLLAGALYFWGAHLNNQANEYKNLPLIPGTSTTPTVQ